MRFEHLVNFSREKKRADIVILDKDRVDTPYIIVEVKKLKLQDGKAQLRSYRNATGAPIAVWTNGQQISHYHRRDPNHFEDITETRYKADEGLYRLQRHWDFSHSMACSAAPNSDTISPHLRKERTREKGFEVFSVRLFLAHRAH